MKQRAPFDLWNNNLAKGSDDKKHSDNNTNTADFSAQINSPAMQFGSSSEISSFFPNSLIPFGDSEFFLTLFSLPAAASPPSPFYS